MQVMLPVAPLRALDRGKMVTVNAEHRLVTYGTLAPGRPNHHQLASLEGRWIPAIVRGDLVRQGWAAEAGYPALVLNPHGAPIEVQVFESADLPAHWHRLDDFEGTEYRRVVATVETDNGPMQASIYVPRTLTSRGGNASGR